MAVQQPQAETSSARAAIPGPKRDGFPSATIMSAGFAAFVLGLLTTWAEASTGFKDWLTFNDDVGPLSGKTTMAVVAFVVSWPLLSFVLWKRDHLLNIALVVSAVLVVAGLVGTFPTFFQAFE